MKDLFKHKMAMYGIIIPLLFAIEWFVPYRYGVVSFLLYMITPLRFALCLYMRSYCETRIRKGDDFGYLKKIFTFMAVVYLVDFAANLGFTNFFPEYGARFVYFFFAYLTYFEFLLNAYMYYQYFKRLEDKYLGAQYLWVALNLALTFAFLYMHIKAHQIMSIDSKWYLFIVLLFLIREPLKLRISVEEPVNINDSGDLS